MPRHVAIIMDGNGRWAAARGHPRSFGHKQGMEALRAAVRHAALRKIEYLTLYAFSSENWARPKDEINDLFGLLRRFVQKNLAELHEENVRVHIIGGTENFDEDIRGLLKESQNVTANNTGLQLVIALNYGSRQEITKAAQNYAEDFAAGKRQALTPELFSSYLQTSTFPDPDLIIRTSGEQRLSNFLLWQLAYAEFIFLPVLWPDFDASWFDKALDEFAGRERRYGGLASVSG